MFRAIHDTCFHRLGLFVVSFYHNMRIQPHRIQAAQRSVDGNTANGSWTYTFAISHLYKNKEHVSSLFSTKNNQEEEKKSGQKGVCTNLG